MKFHHVGIAVEDIETSLTDIKKQYSVSEVSEIVWDNNQKAFLCMVTMEDGFKMELISGEPAKPWIKRGQHLYHVCYEVNDIYAEVEKKCQSTGSILVSEPKEAILFSNKKVAFIRTALGLIELVEE
ncbi:MAG: VOC family protein [Lachnospira sp.]|nr:VOC family protein [Lachnospira sp.]